MSELSQRMDNEQLENDKIQESFSRINAARKAQDHVGFRDQVLEMATYFDQHERFEHAIGILKDALKTELLEESTHALPVIDRLVGLLLKTEDYVALNEVLKLRRSKIPTHGSPHTLQKFYEAVCLEGLGKHHEAIRCLNDIEDTLSNTNLASKYLKLTMLHLRTNQYALAEEMFAKALIFDASENNPIFKLIRSDLAYARNEYLEAMKSYQDYFIQSKARNRYLDRYLAICTRTGDYEEALRFYHTYKQEVDQQVSKQARIRFYEAALELLQMTEHLTEYDECYRKLASTQKNHSEPMDWPAAYASIAPSALPYGTHRDPRRIVLEMLRKIQHQLINQRCEFVYKEDDKYIVLTYCEDHLRQKILTDDEASSTLLPKMIGHKASDIFLQNEALSACVDHLNGKSYPHTVCVMMVSVICVSFAHAHIVIVSEVNDHIVRDRNFINVCAQWLEAHLDTFVHVHEERERNRYLLDALARTETALLRIEKGIIHFLTPQALSLFDVEHNNLPFEALQARMPDTEKVFIDELYTRSSWSFRLLLTNGTTREIHANIWQDELALMLMCFETSHGEGSSPSYHTPSILASILPIQHVFHQKTCHHPSLVIAHFPGLENHISQRTFSLSEAWYQTLQTTITQSAKKHYEATYMIDPERIAIGLSTTDKRVIERMSSSLIRFCESYPHGFNVSLPRVSTITHLSQLTQEALVKRVYQVAYATDSDSRLFESDMKAVTTREALYLTITESFRIHIKQKDLAYLYQPVVQWNNRAIALLLPHLNPQILFGTKTDIVAALHYHDLWPLLLQQTIIYLGRLARRWALMSLSIPRFALHLSNRIAVNKKAIDDIISQVHKATLEPSHIIFVCPYRSWSVLTQRNVQTLSEAGFGIGLSDWAMNIAAADTEQLRIFEYGFLSHDEFTYCQESWLQEAASLFRKGLIYDHEHHVLKRSDLELKHIQLVYGDLYPSLDETTLIKARNERGENE